MNATLKSISLAVLLSAMASPALAASSVQEGHSGFAVWAFLGFCALIVALQLVPAALMLIGILKGVFAKAEKPALNSAE
ncbi:hypothetical protein DESUT3_37250 [Desulfuromonas versatilis]|uniref:Uncharacterized protein n=1 Tax=Desulfuromonas versatilis TaxID=2802975 RepID=A0ABN6E7C4_9BACT|nr:hypothetical protein [Desulfuromonas versatilis]BCR06656.1 hypothetical protein DESUT3_37250 [Desulfuromonas versatilis]